MHDRGKSVKLARSQKVLQLIIFFVMQNNAYIFSYRKLVENQKTKKTNNQDLKKTKI